MKKMIITLSLLALVLLSSCDIFIKDPALEDKKVYMVSVALDYKDTSLNTLKGTLNDQHAIEMQLEYLARSEGVDFECMSYSEADDSWTCRNSLYQARIGETVETSHSVGRSSMKKLIMAELEEMARTVDDNDIFIFYYAGHGGNSIDGSDNSLDGALVVGDILFPSVGHWQDEGTNLASLISLYELKSQLSHIKAAKLVILDSCYSGSLLPQERQNERRWQIMESLSSIFEPGSDGNNRLYLLTSSASDELSYEDDSKGVAHGFFSAAVLEALGYKFYDDGVEGVGTPEDPIVCASSIMEHVNQGDIVQYQSPQINDFQLDLILFNLTGPSRF